MIVRLFDAIDSAGPAESAALLFCLACIVLALELIDAKRNLRGARRGLGKARRRT